MWHPVAFADDLDDQPMGVRLLDEAIAIARIDGDVAAFKDFFCKILFAPLPTRVCPRPSLQPLPGTVVFSALRPKGGGAVLGGPWVARGRSEL